MSKSIPAGSNTGFTRQSFEAELTKLGKIKGMGDGARVEAFMRGVEVASKLPDVKADAAKDLWMLFANAAAMARGKEYSAGASLTVQVSKFRQSLILGALQDIDPVDVMYRTDEVLKRLQRMDKSGGVKGSTYDNLVAVARKQIGQPTVPLTDDEIQSIVVKESEKKTDLDKLLDLYKRTAKVHDDFKKDNSPACAGVAATLNVLEDTITEMGGELPPVTAEEKARASVLAKAAKLGITIAPQPAQPLAALIRNGEKVA